MKLSVISGVAIQGLFSMSDSVAASDGIERWVCLFADLGYCSCEYRHEALTCGLCMKTRGSHVIERIKCVFMYQLLDAERTVRY